MSANARKLLNLFDRPGEPVFMPKGDNEVFEVPQSYLVDRYKPLQQTLSNRFGTDAKKIRVQEIRLPDISEVEALGKKDNFSIFIPYHRKLASKLVNLLIGMRNVDELLSLAVYARDRVNRYLFVYALSVALLHRQDTRDLPLPSLPEIFPEKFLEGDALSTAQEETNVLQESGQREPIVIPRDYTASDLELEHRCAYFREDLGINVHHWHWHLVYPFDEARAIVDKDRRGELFYYMHQQIIARYNFERFSNDLARVTRLTNWRDPIPEGYFPKMDSLVSGRNWASRMENVVMRDIDREVDQLKFDIQDLERWRDRIYTAIHTGIVIDNSGNSQELSEYGGIDVLGNIVEASVLSVNKNYYGDLHNFLHAAISLSHDPGHKHLESFQPIGDPATSMRDPVFYKLHCFIDDLFLEHKNTLPPYTLSQLGFQGVRVMGVEVSSTGQQQKNTLLTFWQQSDVDFSRGLDFSPRGPVLARFTHLQHTPFTYTIQVESNENTMGTVRIFLAPKFDERGLPMLFRDQKNLFVELDRFTQRLKKGRNTVTRRSDQSNLTVPFERTFRNVDATRPADGTAALQDFNFCGCGWPQHMLIPKGNAAGLPCELFVMVSNYRDDSVEGSDNKECSDAAMFCGLRDAKYPDRRPMGYPFDRQGRAGSDVLRQFLTPNMTVRDVTIKFTERTVVPPSPGLNSPPKTSPS